MTRRSESKDERVLGLVDLVWLLEMSHEQYLERFRGTSVRRAKHWMLQRNAAVVLGNTGGVEAVAPLKKALAESPNPIVRGHAAWALAQVGARTGTLHVEHDLRMALEAEEDKTVREEIIAALDDLGANVTEL